MPSLTLHVKVSLGTYHEHVSIAQETISFIALLTNAAPNARGIGLTGGLRETKMDITNCFPSYDVRTPLSPAVGPKIRTLRKTWELHGRALAS